MMKKNVKQKNKSQADTFMKRAFEAVQASQPGQIKALKSKLKEAINLAIPKSVAEKHASAQRTLLHYAVLDPAVTIETIKALLEAGADPNVLTGSNNTALSIAITINHSPEVLQLLIENKAKILTGLPTSPLSVAIDQNNLEVTKMLLKELEKQNVDMQAVLYQSPQNDGSFLALAIRKENLALVLELLKYAKAKSNDNNNQVNYIANDRTLLLLAINTGNAEIVEALIQAGADTKIAVSADNPPLDLAAKKNNVRMAKAILAADPKAPQRAAIRYAAQWDNLEMVSLLLKAGADVNAKTCEKKELGAFDVACMVGNQKVIDLLFPHADLTNINFNCYSAAHYGHAHLVEYLLERGADVNHLTHDSSLMETASYNGHENVVEVLKKYKVNMENSADALIHAIIQKNLDMVNLQLVSGADPNRPNANGGTPMEAAFSRGTPEIAEALLKAGAILSEEIVYMAAADGRLDFLRIFLEYGANINEMSAQEQETPLHAAIREGHITTAEFLIKKGADINAFSEEADSRPLDIACIYDNKECIHLLLAAGADVNLVDANGLGPTHIAVCKNNLPVLEILFSRKETALYPQGEDAIVPIALAAEMGNGEAFAYLLKIAKQRNQLPTLDLWVQIFYNLLPDDEKDANKKLPIFGYLLDELSNKEFLTFIILDFIEMASVKFSEDDDRKPHLQKYIQVIFDKCIAKSITFPDEFKDKLSSVTDLEIEKLFVTPVMAEESSTTANENQLAAPETGNENENNTKANQTKASGQPRAQHIPVTQMLSMFKKMQSQDVIRVRKEKTEPPSNENKPVSIFKPAAEKKQLTWGNGLIASDSKMEDKLIVKEVDFGNNQFFYCPQSMVNLLELNQVASVFESVMEFPKIARLVNQPGLKSLDIDHPAIDINVIDPVTNKVIPCKGEINFEVKTMHAQFKKERLLCVSITGDGGKGSLIVPILYLPEGLHGNDDAKALTEKLKYLTSFNIMAPHTDFQNRIAVGSS